jgi:hypothetical protein
MSLDPPLPGGGPSIYETRNILVVYRDGSSGTSPYGSETSLLGWN